jgi:hypothetical protein
MDNGSNKSNSINDNHYYWPLNCRLERSCLPMPGYRYDAENIGPGQRGQFD